jgi:hypothetical protein
MTEYLVFIFINIINILKVIAQMYIPDILTYLKKVKNSLKIYQVQSPLIIFNPFNHKVTTTMSK